MQISARHFAVASTTYFIGTVLSKITVFLMLPVYTRYISPADYGYYDMTMAYLNIISSVLFFDIWTAVMRFMFDRGTADQPYKAAYNGLVILGFSFILYFATALIFAQTMQIPYFAEITACGFSLCCQNFYSCVARGFRENTLFAFAGVVNTLVTVGSNFILIVGYGMDYSALYLSFILGNFIQVGMLEWKLRLAFRLRRCYFQRAVQWNMIKYAAPLCLNSVGYWLMTDYNRTVVYHCLTAAENGFFAMASKFSLALLLVSSCFNLAWQELAFEKGGQGENTGDFYSAAGNLFLKFLLCGGILMISTIALLFPWMMSSAYGPARELIPGYLLVTMLSVYSIFLGNIFGALKQTNVIFTSTVGACVVNIILLYEFIPVYRVQAAVVALLGGYLVNVAIRSYLLRKLIHYRIQFMVFLKILPAAIVAISAYFFLSYEENFAVFILLFLGCFWFLKNDLLLIWQKICRPKGVETVNGN